MLDLFPYIPNQIILGDALDVLKTLPDECVQMVVTSPPYFGLRDYQVPGQIGFGKRAKDIHQKTGFDLPRNAASANV